MTANTLANFFLEVGLRRARLEGKPLDEAFVAGMRVGAALNATRVLAEFRSHGVPQGLRDLLAARRKKDAEGIARRLTIARQDFVDLVTNADTLGYRHQLKSREHVPEALRRGDCMDFARISAIFKQRQVVTAHLFERDDEWHCFCFTYRDAVDARRTGFAPHWHEGTHFHYLSHLWGARLKKDNVWNALDTRTYGIPSLHIRYREAD